MIGRSHRRRPAHTLLEMLFASAVLGLFLIMVGHAVVIAYRSQARSSQKASEFRSATLGLERYGRELRLCKKVYMPDPTTWAVNTSFLAEKGTNPPFIFVRFNRHTNLDEVVSYQYDPVSRELLRALYNPDYDPTNLSSNAPIEAPRRLAYAVVSLKVTRLDPVDSFGIQLLRSEMELSPVYYPLTLDVKVKGL